MVLVVARVVGIVLQVWLRQEVVDVVRELQEEFYINGRDGGLLMVVSKCGSCGCNVMMVVKTERLWSWCCRVQKKVLYMLWSWYNSDVVQL